MEKSKMNSKKLLIKSNSLSLIIAVICLVLINSVQLTTSIKARKYIVKNYFQGLPKRSDFELVEYELPPLRDGEVVVKAEWISVDPYIRWYNRDLTVPYNQFSFQVGSVIESKDPEYPVGTKIVTHKGWCDYSVVNTTEAFSHLPIAITYKLPDFKGLSTSRGIGDLGMPGVTAYVGLLDICEPKAGDTVVITGAAGAVGSVAGQIAKIKGCKVIGLAGSDRKVEWLEKDLGFDKAINYKTADIGKSLKEAAPNGVDCYFDNVGGETSSIIMSQMNNKGKVAVCGSISSYNDDVFPKVTTVQQYIVFKELKVQGFLITNLVPLWPNALDHLIDWAHSGLLKPTEHITEGFENLFDAFMGVLAGENVGKAVVKI